MQIQWSIKKRKKTETKKNAWLSVYDIITGVGEALRLSITVVRMEGAWVAVDVMRNDPVVGIYVQLHWGYQVKFSMKCHIFEPWWKPFFFCIVKTLVCNHWQVGLVFLIYCKRTCRYSEVKKNNKNKNKKCLIKRFIVCDHDIVTGVGGRSECDENGEA